jgi:hypothetical protein
MQSVVEQTTNEKIYQLMNNQLLPAIQDTDRQTAVGALLGLAYVIVKGDATVTDDEICAMAGEFSALMVSWAHTEVKH